MTEKRRVGVVASCKFHVVVDPPLNAVRVAVSQDENVFSDIQLCKTRLGGIEIAVAPYEDLLFFRRYDEAFRVAQSVAEEKHGVVSSFIRVDHFLHPPRGAVRIGKHKKTFTVKRRIFDQRRISNQ